MRNGKQELIAIMAQNEKTGNPESSLRKRSRSWTKLIQSKKPATKEYYHN